MAAAPASRMKSRRLMGSGFRAPGQQHRYASLVGEIFIAECRNEIALFQKDANEDVGRRNRGKHQMSGRHRGRCPECDDEAEIDRMPHELVVDRRTEARRGWRLAGEIVDDLMQ